MERLRGMEEECRELRRVVRRKERVLGGYGG
jgi:hypothetical protein